MQVEEFFMALMKSDFAEGDSFWLDFKSCNGDFRLELEVVDSGRVPLPTLKVRDVVLV